MALPTDLKLPVRITSDDFTLGELDRIDRLRNDGTAPGIITAQAFVWLKREHPSVKMGDVAQLRSGDVLIDEPEDQGDDDENEPAPGLSVDPTNAP